jgi:hypothetical protein
MSAYDLLLFAHVFGAFALIAGTTALAPFALGTGAALLERPAVLRTAVIGAAASTLGGTLTLVFGLWLVANRDYAFLRLWIVGALVLWAISGYSNTRVAAAARGERDGEPLSVNLRALWAADAIGAIVILLLMVYKPGH